MWLTWVSYNINKHFALICSNMSVVGYSNINNRNIGLGVVTRLSTTGK